MLRSRALFALALCLAAAPAPALATAPIAHTPASDFEFRASRPVFVAEDNFSWVLAFDFHNRSGVGLYTDSLLCDIQDLDAGETGASRHSVVSLWSAARMAESVAAGDSVHCELQMPASIEKAHLTFHYFGHRADRSAVTALASADVMPGASSARMPSAFVNVGAQRIEYVQVPAATDGPAPALLVIPGEGRHARSILGPMQAFAARGYHVITMSLPGFGLSQGTADFMGPGSVAAASRVLDQVRGLSGVDSTRIVVWGMREGAAVAVLLASQRPDLEGVIAESGCYEPWACWRAGDPAWRKRMSAAAGADSAAWRARSAMNVVERLRQSTLVVHGENDMVTPAAQAHAFVAALMARGVDGRELMLPGRGHDVSGSQLRAVMDFMQRLFPR
ncbi:MAG: prolyl oligopeptidase family serine peptidase [Candidatus Eisenbacteria bacterium]|nr:prolyl oligopeptidase family serine peptidase [Candidatus Eisenbacteria bacterium]